MFCSQLFPLIETSSKFQCPLATCSTFNPSKNGSTPKDNVGISTTRITMARRIFRTKKNTSPCCKTNIYIYIIVYIYIINIPTKKTARTKQPSQNPTNKNQLPNPPQKNPWGRLFVYIYINIYLYVYRCIVDIF